MKIIYIIMMTVMSSDIFANEEYGGLDMSKVELSRNLLQKEYAFGNGISHMIKNPIEIKYGCNLKEIWHCKGVSM